LNEKTEKALSAFLRPEFINRIDEIITFRSLDRDDFVKIAKIMLGELKNALEEKSVKFLFSDKAAEYIAQKSFSVKFGARNMRRFIQTNVEDELAERIISSYNDRISAVSLDADENGLVIKTI